MAVKIPEGRTPKRVMVRATMPTTAQMLSDLRETLVNQIAEHKRTADTSLQSAKVTMTLMQAARDLEAQTEREQDKAQDLFESADPEERAQLEAEARKLLGS